MLRSFLHPIVVTKKISADLHERKAAWFSQKGSKRSWCIEMNEAWELYICTYGVIDTMDHMVKNCHMFYRTWKYWHAAMNLAKVMTIS
jgi:hypothetical protein